MATSSQGALTPQQAAVLAAVVDLHEVHGRRPVAASWVADKLSMTRQRVCEYFIRLNELGHLLTPGAPAVPTPLTKTQLPIAGPACDVPNVKRTVQVPPLSIRADVSVQSANDEARTVDLVFTTGAPVQRYDWMSDTRYLETLSLDPAHVRLDRLNTIGPLLDGHSAYSVGDILGSVVPGSVSLTKKAGRATVRFSKRTAVDPIWQDVKDGHIRSVSVGYRVYRFEETVGEKNALPVRLATDWEPFEISMVPIPADAGAAVRGERPKVEPNSCEVVTRAAAPLSPTKEKRMDPEETPSETLLEEDEPAPVPRKADPPPPDETAVATRIERERSQGILLGCRAARLPQSFADKLIADGVSLVESQTRILAELAKRGGDDRGPGRGPSGGDSVVIVGDDPFVHKRKGMENALLHRAMPRVAQTNTSLAYGFDLSEEGKQYRGLGLMDIADICLRSKGVRVTSLSKMERASLALRASGMHTTSDFPLLLADVMNKVLRAAYEAQPPTWGPISKDVPLADFKPTKQLQIGDAPALLEVMEHGEFTSGTIAEGKEQFQLKTYGRIFAITRQAIINDDLNAFADIPAAFGRMARVKESDLAWAEIISNPVMGDGVVLFHATHANLDTVNAAIAVAPIGKGRAAMRVQKGLDLVTLLNLNPAFLIVPAALETVADQFVSAALMASAPGSVNPFAGRLQVISEPRLDANSVTAWYLATAVPQCPVLFHGTLDGQPGPEVTQEQGFDVDGVRMKCRIDVAFKAADFHGVWKNVGV